VPSLSGSWEKRADGQLRYWRGRGAWVPVKAASRPRGTAWRRALTVGDPALAGLEGEGELLAGQAGGGVPPAPPQGHERTSRSTGLVAVGTPL
jgi:hypothetical protein